MTKPATLRVSAGQFAPGENKQENLAEVTKLIESAAADNVRLIVLPELSMWRRHGGTLADAIASAEPLDGPFVSEVVRLSKEHSIAVAIGIYETVPEELGDKDHVYNSLVIADKGEVLTTYRKLHLYDAFTAKESESIRPGEELAPILNIDGFTIGFAICYDIRFPEMFRLFADHKVDAIALATAWARGVGKEEHWDVLTRSRAIENTAYMIASDEVSINSVGRSRVLDPFGYSLGDAGEQKHALVTANLSHERIAEVRATLPALQNRRFTVNSEIHPVGSV